MPVILTLSSFSDSFLTPYSLFPTSHSGMSLDQERVPKRQTGNAKCGIEIYVCVYILIYNLLSIFIMYSIFNTNVKCGI